MARRSYSAQAKGIADITKAWNSVLQSRGLPPLSPITSRRSPKTKTKTKTNRMNFVDMSMPLLVVVIFVLLVALLYGLTV